MRTENREKFVFFHLFFYFVAPAGFEPATSPPKGDVLPLHHGTLDSFVPVVLAAHVVAASEPVPVCCASAIRRRGAVSSSLAHDPPIWVLSAYPILFLPLRAGVILPEHQTPHLCGWLSLWCRQDSNLQRAVSRESALVPMTSILRASTIPPLHHLPVFPGRHPAASLTADCKEYNNKYEKIQHIKGAQTFAKPRSRKTSFSQKHQS